MKHIPSYGSIYALGHRAIRDMFEDEVQVEEKIDGSQCSFGIIEGELCFRSKGKDVFLDSPEKMFERAIEVIRTLDLRPEWIYRGEYLQKPKHNSLAYARIPKNHIILFDVERAPQDHLTYDEKCIEAERLCLETVPLLLKGKVEDLSQFQGLLDRESILGLCKIEGVVVKNYSRFTAEKKFYMGKYVSEAFKEVHGIEWKKNNPTRSDLIEILVQKYTNEARWKKAIQHLSESGKIDGSPKDIGPILKEIPADIRKECEEEIKEALFVYYWPQISRRVTNGFPEWYKQKLLSETLGETA